jgi:hypothetical protein
MFTNSQNNIPSNMFYTFHNTLKHTQDMDFDFDFLIFSLGMCA